MLNRLRVRGFKSVADVTVELPRFAVFFGPNATGKSNLLEAIQALSRIATSPTLADALVGDPDSLVAPSSIRGRIVELFSFGKGGIPALVRQRSAHFTLEADISTKKSHYRYRVQPSMNFRSGEFRVSDEYLARLRPTGTVLGTPAIETNDGDLQVRQKGTSGPRRPRMQHLDRDRSVLSDRSLSGNGYSWLDDLRSEFAGWRTYHLEPRFVMRQEDGPRAVTDIGTHGDNVVPFLNRLKVTEPGAFQAAVRTLRTIAPSVETLEIDLDERCGILEMHVRQDGISYSSRVLSEGTLRILALCAIAVNPWTGSLVALEEPENSVHPSRIEFVARLLISLSTREQHQVIVTTHSPTFVDAVRKIQSEDAGDGVGLFNVQLSDDRTAISPMDATGSLLDDDGANVPASLGN